MALLPIKDYNDLKRISFQYVTVGLIAACVADTRAEAEDLVEQIIVDFDELPVLANIVDAQNPARR